jgi:multiple sugar transport system substrate-binding protein
MKKRCNLKKSVCYAVILLLILTVGCNSTKKAGTSSTQNSSEVSSTSTSADVISSVSSVSEALSSLGSNVLVSQNSASTKSSSKITSSSRSSSSSPMRVYQKDNTITLLTPKGTEKNLTVLSEAAMNLGAGVFRTVIGQYDKILTNQTLGADGNFQYAFSKYLYNANLQQNITLTFEDWSWGDPLAQKETAAFLAGYGPDVIIGESQSPGFATQNVLEPFPDWLDKLVREQISPAAWKPMEYKGKIYGVAAEPGVSLLIWNKSVLKQAGIDQNIIDNGVTTWDQWLSVAQKINKNSAFFPGGCYMGGNGGGYLRAGAFMRMNGGDFVDKNNDPSFNSAQNIKTMEFLRSLANLNPKGLICDASFENLSSNFQNGQMAYIVDGPWKVKQSRDSGLDVGFCTLPQPTGGKAANITMGAAFLSVPKYSKNKDNAFKYISAYLTTEAQSIIAMYDIRPVVNRQLGDSKDYQTQHPDMYKVYKALSGDVIGLPTFKKENSKVWEQLGYAFVKVAATNSPVKTILDASQEQAQTILK